MAARNSNSHGKIDFDNLGIAAALQRGRLSVPLNQREYSWEDKHVTELFQDFSNAISTNRSSYFLGTIVLTGIGDSVPEVADGQQRLATTTILLAAIRDYYFSRNDHTRVNTIQTRFLFESDLDTNQIEPRLQLNATDNDFFRKKILSSPDSADRNTAPKKQSHERIQRASELAKLHVETILKPLAETNRIPLLNAWVKFLETTALVILLKVPDDLNAFVMFETLNDRGLKTSQADLLKNYLFGESDDRIDEAQNYWAATISALETLEIDDIALIYLRHFVSSIHGLTRDREVFAKIKSTVSGKNQSIDFLNKLSENAADYVAILTPSHTKWANSNKIKNSITTINALAAVPLRPLMLAVSTNFDINETERAFRLFVSWTVRFLIVGGGRSSSTEAAYAEQAKEINQKKIKTAKALSAALADTIPTDAEFENEFSTVRISKNSFARYYLRALELQIKGDSQPELIPNEDATQITLEHILPENPANAWGNIAAETAAAFYKRIGNMVLLKASQNKILGNDSYAEKAKVFKISPYKLTEEAGKETSWGIAEINDRQKKLAKIAVKTWPLSFS